MKYSNLFALVILSIINVGFAASWARADLVGHWDYEGLTTGDTTVPNLGSGGWGTLGDGTVSDTVAFVADASRGGTVAQFTGEGCISLGDLPSIDYAATDFSFSFWGKLSGTAASTVVFGNRYDGGANNSWIKFTGNKFEYQSAGSSFGSTSYANGGTMSTDWANYIVVKNGTQLSLYQNGEKIYSNTLTSAASISATMPFYMGGDKTNERWSGYLDDVRVYNNALGYIDVLKLSGTTIKAVPVPALGSSKTLAYANESGTLDTSVWKVKQGGLQTQTGTDYSYTLRDDGIIGISGTAVLGSGNYWNGLGVQTVETFNASATNQISFSLNRVGLVGTNNYRSSLWFLSEDESKWVHLGHNTENNSKWAWNANDNQVSGGGNVITDSPTSFKQQIVTLTHDGSAVKMYIDGKFYASHSVDFNTFSAFVNAMGRANGDTVEAYFSAPVVTARTYDNLYDDFSSNSIGTKWTPVAYGVETKNGTYPIGSDNIKVADGVLTMTGNCSSVQYWPGYTVRSTDHFATSESLEFAVDREAITSTGAGGYFRSSMWLWADDQNWISFGQMFDDGQTSQTWQYNYSVNGEGQLTNKGTVFTGDVANIKDTGLHTLRLEMNPLDDDGFGAVVDMYVDNILAGTLTLDNWDTSLSAYMMLTASPRSGETVTGVFDNAVIRGMQVPEPSSWALLILGIAGVWLVRKRK